MAEEVNNVSSNRVVNSGACASGSPGVYTYDCFPWRVVIDKLDTDHIIINYGNAQLTIWPIEGKEDAQEEGTD